MSSQGSPDSSSKKRKSPFDSLIGPGLTNKRRRNSALSLSKKHMEQHSQKSNESFRFEDEDTRSLTSVSVMSVSSQQVVSDYSTRDYTPIATKFGVNVTVAKKYYAFLNNQPKVAIMRIKPIKRELFTAAELLEMTNSNSPVFSSKKKGKKKEFGSLLSEGYLTNNNDNLVKNETLKKKKLNKRVKKNIANYLQTLNNCNVEQEISPQNSFTKDDLNTSGNVEYDSGSEFQTPRHSSSRREKPFKKSEILINPFSKDTFLKDSQAATITEVSEKKKSYWMKKFGHVERHDRKKMFLQTFVKKESIDSETETANEPESGIEPESKKMRSINKNVENKEVKSKKLSRRRKRIVMPNSDTESDADIQTLDSLSVNFPQFSSLPSGNVKCENHALQMNGQISPIMSFGERGKEDNEDEYVDSDKNVSLHDDIIDLCPDLSESIELIAEEIAASNNLVDGKDEISNETATLNNLVNGEDKIANVASTPEHLVNGKDNILNEIDAPDNLVNEKEEIENETTATYNNLANGNDNGNLSDDLFDSPTEPASPSDRLVIDLTPRSSTEPQVITIGSSSSGDSPRPKGKPKIKSDTKLKNNIIFTKIPSHKNLKRPRKTSPSSPGVEANELYSPSTSSSSSQVDSNSPRQDIESNSATPTTRGLRSSIQQVKCNLNNEESLKEYQNAKTSDDKHADETFDSICRDLTNLSNTENITLFKGKENIESSGDSVVLLGDLKKDAEPKEDSTTSAVVTNDAIETQSTAEPAALETSAPADPQSPIFKSNRKTSLKSTTSKPFNPADAAIALGQQKTPARLTRSMANSSANPPASNPFRGFTIPRKNPQQNKSVAPPQVSRDPRLNRSLSPNKLLGTPAADARVTRSTAAVCVPKSPGVSPADPRLTRGQSRPRSATPTPPTNISPSIDSGKEIEITSKAEDDKKIVDPRLRKRKEREEAERAAKLAQEQQELAKARAAKLAQEKQELAKANAAKQELAKANAAKLAQEQQELARSAELAQEQELASASVEQPEQAEVPQFGQDVLRTPSPKRKRSNVFQRLGNKDSPPKNEFMSIIKSIRRNPSPTKSPCETDDDISLHPGISDFYDSSDEEDKDSSPRHRKFESERNRTAAATSSTAPQTKARPPQRRLSVKERIGMRVGDAVALGDRRAANGASALAPPTVNTTLLNRQARFGLGVRPPVPQQPLPRNLLPNFTVPPPNLFAPPPTTTPNASFNMDSFYQMNARQMMQDQSNLVGDEDPAGSDVYVTFDGDAGDQPSEYDHVSILDNKPGAMVKGLSDPRFTFFRNQCFRVLRDGKCNTELTTCNFKHQVTLLLRTVKTKDPDCVKAILDTCIEQNFDYYLDNVWKSILPIIKTDAFAFYEKLYTANRRNLHFVLELLEYCLTENVHTVESFLRVIAPVIADKDTATVQAICAKVKGRIADGFCWETIKVICKKAAPPRDMVELVLLQCLKRKKNLAHIMEVHDMIKTKMIASDRSKISRNMLEPFYDLVRKLNPSVKDMETLATMPLNNVTNSLINGQSFERHSVNAPKAAVQPLKTAKSTVNTPKRKEPATIASPDDAPLSSPDPIQVQTPVRGESTDITEYNPKPVDFAEPKSAHRDRFWKLYSTTNAVNTGLTHQDYNYVWEELQKFIEKEIPNEFCRRAFYLILCKNVKTSEDHMREIIKRAVRKSSERLSCLLFEVGIHALIDLGNSEYWLDALQLLDKLKIFEPKNLPVAYVLICAEIYLANNDPSEALALLQRTKLIRTNRDEWLVNDSQKADEKHRNKVVFILLQGLAYLEPDKAVFLFKELMADQYIYYYPIDLSRYLDKFTLLLLMHKRLDLAAEISREIMANDMTFSKPTYQELLSRLLSVDEVLVNQLLEYAVNLGYYNDINIRPGFITLIMDFNYTEEEVYLILKRMIHKLTLNLGPAIPRLKSSHLKVTLVLEDIPTGKRLYQNETVTKISLNKNKQMRRLIGHILASRFSPAIKLSQTKADRFCKIMSRTLVDHLQHWH